MEIKNKQLHKILDIVSLVMLGLMIIIILIGMSWIIKFLYNGYVNTNSPSQSELQNATLQGYYQAQIELNNIWLRDLGTYGYTIQNVIYQNQTYQMRCEVKQ